MAAIRGRMSKIKRYYWRELHRRELELLAEATGVSDVVRLSSDDPAIRTAREVAEKRALQEMTLLHGTNPKYVYRSEESQDALISANNVTVVRLVGVFAKHAGDRKTTILRGAEHLIAEDFAARHFNDQGYFTIAVESVPFHVLCGTYMWPLFEDSSDERVGLRMIPERPTDDCARTERIVRFLLPEDFGKAGYGRRRKQAIDEHFVELAEGGDLLWLFDYWLGHSERIRQYLWAHRERHIETARRLVEVLPANIILRILRYLVDSYWERYLGWPDLLVFGKNDFFFAEVKASKDTLSDEQEQWIRNNHRILNLPYKLVKIHKSGVANHHLYEPPFDQGSEPSGNEVS